MSAKKFKKIAIPIIAILLILVLAVNIAASKFDSFLDHYLGGNPYDIISIEGSEGWDTNYYEGKYATNERLAKGRAQAVLGYVSSHFNFNDGVVRAESVAENWEGLREFVENSSLKNKAGILAVIDDESLAPDVKEQRIRSKYPADWKTLGKDCFPYLRRTAYIISYKTIDVEAGVTNAEKATRAMEAGDFESAALYLDKAGDGAEAEFARGTYFASMEQFEEAAEHFRKAAAGGIQEAEALAQELERAKYINPNKPVPQEEVAPEE